MNHTEIDRIELQDGDFEEFLSTHFATLYDLKKFHDGRFQLNIIVDKYGPKSFILFPSVVSMCSALDIEIIIENGANQSGDDNSE